MSTEVLRLTAAFAATATNENGRVTKQGCRCGNIGSRSTR